MNTSTSTHDKVGRSLSSRLAASAAGMWSKLGTAAVLAAVLIAAAIGTMSSSSATASTGGPDDDGQLLLTSLQTIAPGQSFNGNAGNLLNSQVFHVMAVPLSAGCRMTTTKEELIAQSNAGLLTLFWEVKNIGQTQCIFAVRMSFTG